MTEECKCYIFNWLGFSFLLLFFFPFLSSVEYASILGVSESLSNVVFNDSNEFNSRICLSDTTC